MKINFENPNQNEPFRRFENEEFRMQVRNGFADLLEDRATDPERQGGASDLLAGFAEKIRQGEKIASTPATRAIFRGVFFDDGPMATYGATHVEIDKLERDFIELGKK